MTVKIPLSYFLSLLSDPEQVVGCLPDSRAMLQSDPRISPSTLTKFLSCSWVFIPVLKHEDCFFIHNETAYVDTENVFLSVDSNSQVFASRHENAKCWKIVPESYVQPGVYGSFSLKLYNTEEYICADPTVSGGLIVSSAAQRIVWDVIVHDELVDEP